MVDEQIKADFPVLFQNVNDEPLVYLDNAATTQQPISVMNRVEAYIKHDHANVHRGVHTLAERATAQYEEARVRVQHFIGAAHPEEIIFTKGTTDSLNLVAQSLGNLLIEEGDEIVITRLEHHANFIPWQQLANQKKATLKIIELTKEGLLDLEDAQRKITSKTKIVAVTHVSNVLGVVTPIKELVQLAHNHGALIVVDGAQAVPHFSVNVQALDIDFYAFSAHKMCGPTGSGVLYGKREWLDQMEPVTFGGEMIQHVGDKESTWASLPYKFEAGTPNISGVIGLGEAIKYLNTLGMETIHAHEEALMAYVMPKLAAIEGISIYGPMSLAQRTGVVAFNIEGVHPHDVATALDMQGVAIRAGHHCAQPLLRALNIQSSVRASFYVYNSKRDADALIESILAAKEFFKNGLI